MKAYRFVASLLVVAVMMPLQSFAQTITPAEFIAATDTLTVPMTEEFIGEAIAAGVAMRAIKKAKKKIKKNIKAGKSALSSHRYPCKGINGIRVVTYNVGTFTKSGYNKMPMAADMMKELKADVLSLNELDSCTTRTGGVYQLAEFADLMGGWGYEFTGAIPYKGGSYGIGLAYNPKLKFVDSWGMTLDKGKGSEQRALSVVEFDKLVVASTHLDYKSNAAARNQVVLLTDALTRRYYSSGKLVVLCGDMNATPGSTVMKELQKNWTIVSATGKTYDSSSPHECIDYILVLNNSADYKVKHTAVCNSFKKGDVKTASDHLPVFIDIVPR